MTDSGFSIDPELEARLSDLGGILAHPAGDALVDAVLARLGGSEDLDHREASDLPATPVPTPGVRSVAVDVSTDSSSRWPRRCVVAAVVVLALLVGLVAYGPSRTAIADWLGIGAVRFTSEGPLPSGLPARPGPTNRGGAGVGSSAFADARRKVSFPIVRADPARAGAATAIEADANVPGGLVSVTYDRFTLTEIAAQPDGQPIATKMLPPGTRVEYLSVNGRHGAWISGSPHELGYLDANGAYRNETVRRVGNVLLWEEGGVTYRIEGLDAEEEALAIAAGLR
jgi:hypothetical protein